MSSTNEQSKNAMNASAAKEKPTGLAALREPFPPNQISKLPKPKSKDAPKGRCNECGGWHGLPAVHLDYVGHAALTARLLDVDPNWTWEPLGHDANGLPALDASGGLWIKLTVCGVSRLGYGDAQGKQGGDAMKERIGDALRNAAMRFGAALDLWHKGDLYAHEEEKGEEGPSKGTLTRNANEHAERISEAARKDNLTAVRELVTEGKAGGNDFWTNVWMSLPANVKHYIRDNLKDAA
jgi:hypothetical protein